MTLRTTIADAASVAVFMLFSVPALAADECGSRYVDDPMQAQQVAAALAKLEAETNAKIESLPKLPPASASDSDSIRAQRLKQERTIAMWREIGRKIAYQESRPHILSITANVEDSVLKAYLAKVAHKIQSAFLEQYGKSSFASNGHGTMIVRVSSTGVLLDVEFQSPRPPSLCRPMRSVVGRVAPFDAFPPQVLAKADQLKMALEFSFEPMKDASASVPAESSAGTE